MMMGIVELGVTFLEDCAWGKETVILRDLQMEFGVVVLLSHVEDEVMVIQRIVKVLSWIQQTVLSSNLL